MAGIEHGNVTNEEFIKEVTYTYYIYKANFMQ